MVQPFSVNTCLPMCTAQQRTLGKVPFVSGAPLPTFARPRNPYPAHFLAMHEIIQAAQTHACNAASAPPRHALRLSGGVEKDPRRYNAPSSAEIACTVVGEGPLPPHFISVYDRADDGSGSTHQLSYLSEHVDPLTYPLIHTHGDLGYSNALHSTVLAADTGKSTKSSQGRHISLREFYSHKLFQRYSSSAGIVELPHACGRLFQQYLVDAYVKLESQRIDWVLANQEKLRVDSLSGLLDFLESAPAAHEQTGQPIILPATFGGSPRSLHQAYLDSMVSSGDNESSFAARPYIHASSLSFT